MNRLISITYSLLFAREYFAKGCHNCVLVLAISEREKKERVKEEKRTSIVSLATTMTATTPTAILMVGVSQNSWPSEIFTARGATVASRFARRTRGLDRRASWPRWRRCCNKCRATRCPVALNIFFFVFASAKKENLSVLLCDKAVACSFTDRHLYFLGRKRDLWLATCSHTEHPCRRTHQCGEEPEVAGGERAKEHGRSLDNLFQVGPSQSLSLSPTRLLSLPLPL